MDGGKSRDPHVEVARKLIPQLESASPLIEQARRLPDDILAALHESGLLRLLVPRSYGGAELHPRIFAEVIEQLAQGDASAAWCVAQGSGCSMASAYFQPAVAQAVFGDRRAALAWGPGAGGKAVAVAGGYRATGAWNFASGSAHATYLGGHCRVFEADGSPRLDKTGKPVERSMLIPRKDAAIKDNWQVMGLRGTASNSYSVTDLFVPEDYTFVRESPTERREDGPLYKFSAINIYGIGFGALSLGLARAMLESFKLLAQEKTPFSRTQTLRENAVVQSQVAVAEARLQSTRAWLLQTIDELWEAAAARGGFTADERMKWRLSTTFAMQVGRELVETLYHAAGASAIFESSPFERRFRDMHAVSQQGQGSIYNYELVGAAMLGLPASARF